MKKRILLFTFLSNLLAIILFSVLSTNIYYRSLLSEEKRSLSAYMNFFDYSYTLDSEGAKNFSQKINGARVTLMTAEGMILGDSEAEEIETDHSARPEVQEAMSSGEGYAVHKSETVGYDMIYYCRLFAERGCMVRIAVSASSQWQIFERTLPTVGLILILSLVGCVVFSFASTSFILKPVQKLANESNEKQIPKPKYRELDRIVQTLNERNENIERQMEIIRLEKAETEKAQRSKDEFISNITHEMNTPLTSIKGYAELLSSGCLSPEQQATAHSTILSQSEKLSALIKRIINYNEIDSDDLPSYDVDASELLRDLLSTVQPEADAAEVEIIVDAEEEVILSSRHERVYQIFSNLIRNAIRYNKKGGSVKVSLNEKFFSVSDTGIGIAPENQEKIFSRFFTVDKSHNGKNGGFGLGLAVVKKICSKSDWKLSLESELGKGSTFTVYFSEAHNK